MIARSTLHSTPGGDTTQILMTAKYLRKAGIDVDIVLAEDSSIVYQHYDIIHFFNIIRPDDILGHVNHNVPFVISTIFVDFSEYDKKQRSGAAGVLFKLMSSWQIEYLKSIARFVVKGDKIKSKYYLLNGQLKSVKKAAAMASVLLPNSNSEYQRLSKEINGDFSYSVVTNAVDQELFVSSITPDENFRNHILCVGRLEGRKNQLNLIRAIAGTDMKLTIIGSAAPNQAGYYKECRTAAQNFSNIQFIEGIAHENLVAIYSAAKVHVLPSWFETTGLSSLEAGAMDCNLVISNKGDTKEYFGDMAFYCQPDDVDSIRAAVVKAFNEPVDPRLKTHILQHYTWAKAAAQTLDAYHSVLQQ